MRKEEWSLGAGGVIDGYTLFDSTRNDDVYDCLCLMLYAVDLRVAVLAFSVVKYALAPKTVLAETKSSASSSSKNDSPHCSSFDNLVTVGLSSFVEEE